MWGKSRRRVLLFLSLVVLALVGLAGPPPASAAFQTGDIFAAVGNSQVKRFMPNGTLAQTLTSTSATTFNTGMCFDAPRNLFVTNFSAGTVTKFDTNGNVVSDPFGGSFSTPESCVVDAAGNIYVGALGSPNITKVGPAGNVLMTYTPGRVDFLDLAADQCTMFYGDEGPTIHRFNVCTNTPLPDFATLPGCQAFQLRIRPNGELLVACGGDVKRVSPGGTEVQSYTPAGGAQLFALNLAPDNLTFYTGNINQQGKIFRINIATETVVTSFDSNANTSLAGLAVAGEISVARPQCSDGIDNDSDGKTDHPADPGCDSPTDNSENSDLPPPPPEPVPPGLAPLGPAGSPPGQPVFECNGLRATHVGGSGPDTIVGTPGRDVIVAGAGKDSVIGGRGNDVICGGSGKDRLSGGSGHDRVFGESGKDRLTGGSGRDRLAGGSGKDRVFGGSGSDRLLGESGADYLIGNAGNDSLGGDQGADTLGGGPGNDRLSGDAGKDRLFGDAGKDLLFRGTGTDLLRGGPGKDSIKP